MTQVLLELARTSDGQVVMLILGMCALVAIVRVFAHIASAVRRD